MKFTILVKVIMLAFLMVSMESRKLNSKSATAMKRFKRNYALTKARLFNITKENVQDLSIGIINGFIEVKKDQFITLLKAAFETAQLTENTLKMVFSKCFPQANKNYEKNVFKSIEEANNKFNAFISLMSEEEKEKMLVNYISACENKETEKIESYTKGYLDNLILVWIENGVRENENGKKFKGKFSSSPYLRPVEEKLVEDIKNYLEYKGSFFNSFAYGMSSLVGKRSICDYVEKKETWTNLIGRWITYASDLLTCGAEELTKELFQYVKKKDANGKEIDVKRYPSLLIKLFNWAFLKITDINLVSLARIVYGFVNTLMEGKTPFYQTGVNLGRGLAVMIDFTGFSFRRK